jgi:hypothetical protein
VRLCQVVYPSIEHYGATATNPQNNEGLEADKGMLAEMMRLWLVHSISLVQRKLPAPR